MTTLINTWMVKSPVVIEAEQLSAIAFQLWNYASDDWFDLSRHEYAEIAQHISTIATLIRSQFPLQAELLDGCVEFIVTVYLADDEEKEEKESYDDNEAG